MFNRRRTILVLKLMVAVSALGYVFWLVEWADAAEVLRQADFRWLAFAFALLLSSFIPAAFRWTVILRSMGVCYALVFSYRTYLIGAFYSLAMPGVIGGDGARIWFCLRDTKASLSIVATTVLVERLLGVVALLLILSFGVFLYPDQSSKVNVGWVPTLALLLVIAIGCFPLILRRLSVVSRSVTYRQDRRSKSRVNRLLAQLSPIKRLTSFHLLGGLTLSVIFQFLDILSTYAISQALGLDLNIQMLLIAIPIVYLATVLPISPGGLGVREVALVIILAQFGLSASDAALLAVTVFLNRVAIGMVGAAQHLASGRRAPQIDRCRSEGNERGQENARAKSQSEGAPLPRGRRGDKSV